MKFFSSTLSRAGSSSSPTSSIRRGLPRDRLSSRCVRKYLWFREVTYVHGGVAMWEGMEEEGGRRKGVVALGTDTQRTNTETENKLLNVRIYVQIQNELY